MASDHHLSEETSTAPPVAVMNESSGNLAEHIKLMESRIEELSEKYAHLATNAGKENAENDHKKNKAKEKEESKKSSTDPDDVDESVELIPELNRITWVEWRKLRSAEAEWQKKKAEQKKREIMKKKDKLRKFVIDVVADTGDLGHHTSADRLPTKDSWTPGRININSEHIIDALNEITKIAVSTPCQILHPFKPIVDFRDELEAHLETLLDKANEAKEARDAALKGSSGISIDKAPAKEPKIGESEMKEKEKVTKTVEEEEYDIAKERVLHYRCLIDLIKTNLAQEINVSESIKNGSARKIMFSHLWHLFPPGETILYQDPDRTEPEQLGQVLKVSGGRAILNRAAETLPWFFYRRSRFRSKYSHFTIDSFHLDFDGNCRKYRLVQDKYEIPRYSGEVPITTLKVFPIRFISTLADAEQALLKRGEIFRGLASVNAAHREYHGMSLDKDKEEINGRIIIDFKLVPPTPSPEYVEEDDEDEEDRRGDRRTFGLKPLSQTSDSEVTETIGRNELDYTLYNDHLYDIDKTDNLFLRNHVLLAPSQEMESHELTKEELRMLPGTAGAYVLRSRRYCKCDISLVREIKLNNPAFDQLVLPKGYQKLIRSLVDKHSYGARPVEKRTELTPSSPLAPSTTRTDTKSTPQDTLSIVKGKGRGLIILLHGVPGVGKTSTAETIAEATGRPLLSVTCGDIGESASEIEKNLEQIFTNSHRWGCVLLLDEAEVFLAKRNLEDLKRNAMVSVFLRVLEYYSGILFLTTNRVGTIDEAFKSRIHVSLYYPPLNWKTSKEVWQVNLDRSKDQIDADDEAILRFAKKHYVRNNDSTRWNGRQIYNAFKTAIALAQIEGKDEDNTRRGSKPKLLPDHFRQIAHVSRKFDEYLLETQGGESYSAWNKSNKVRDDSFGMHDPEPTLKRRSTRTRQLDFNELPTTEEEGTDVSEDLLESSSEEEESEVEVKKSNKKKKQSKSTAAKKKEQKKSGKKKKSRKQKSEDSEESEEGS